MRKRSSPRDDAECGALAALAQLRDLLDCEMVTIEDVRTWQADLGSLEPWRRQIVRVTQSVWDSLGSDVSDALVVISRREDALLIAEVIGDEVFVTEVHDTHPESDAECVGMPLGLLRAVLAARKEKS